MPDAKPPSLAEIEACRSELGDLVRETPVWEWRSARLERRLGARTRPFLKLELFQYAGSFKPRGALTVMRSLTPQQLARGVSAVSAGNHAMAVGYAASVLGTSAKVVMPKNANHFRVAACRELGAVTVLVDNVHQAFDEAHRLEAEEGRFFVHPFDGPLVARGTATLGVELCRQAGELDAVVVPIGGGGLCAGVATAVKTLQPGCAIYGVEPDGADSMHRSFQAGEPRGIERVTTIADSLGAPYALPYWYSLCRRYVDDLVKVSDAELCRAMALLFADAKLAVEPAGAASTAALLGPLRGRLSGKRVGLIICGSNIDAEAFHRCVISAGSEA